MSYDGDMIDGIIRMVDRAFGGCRHNRLTFPISPTPRAPAERVCYQVCLDCGKELPYDWQEMRRA